MSNQAEGALDAVVRLLQVQPLLGEADARLLERFAEANDQAAFRVIVERHGPMVFGVCQRILRCRYDAEDAFQASFLVLSQRAASIRKSDSLSCWLHGVARRTALRLQREQRRRQRREAASLPPAPRDSTDEVTWAEASAALDEEMERLPAVYREALVLCCLEGLTRDEAAGRLGVEVGVVKGRLERARKLLADRLDRRGLTLSAGLLAAALTPGLASATTRAAAMIAAGSPAAPGVSAAVIALANEVLKGMAMTKAKMIGAALACAMLLAGVGIGLAQPPSGGSGQAEEAARVLSRLIVKDTDEAFIRRISRDLRGNDPTPAEVHFFVTCGDKAKREKLVDLFIKERAAVKAAEEVKARLRLETAVRVRERLIDDRVRREYEKREETRLELLRTQVERARLALKEIELELKLAEKKGAKEIEKHPGKLDAVRTYLDALNAYLQLEKKAKPAAPSTTPGRTGAGTGGGSGFGSSGSFSGPPTGGAPPAGGSSLGPRSGSGSR